MAKFDALFKDGVRATFEADTMVVEEGIIVLMRGDVRGRTAVAALGSGELLFIYNTAMKVEVVVLDTEEEDDQQAVGPE